MVGAEYPKVNLPLPGGENQIPVFVLGSNKMLRPLSPKLVPARKYKMSVCLWLDLSVCELFFLFFFFSCASPPPSHQSTRPSTRPVNPSHAQQPEEEEDGHKQEEGVLPVVIAVVEVTVALVITCILV